MSKVNDFVHMPSGKYNNSGQTGGLSGIRYQPVLPPNGKAKIGRQRKTCTILQVTAILFLSLSG